MIENKINLISRLRAQLHAPSEQYEKLTHNSTRLEWKRKDTQAPESLYDSLTSEEKKRKVSGEVSSLFKSFYPCLSDTNKVKFLVNVSGEVFGSDAVYALNEEFV